MIVCMARRLRPETHDWSTGERSAPDGPTHQSVPLIRGRGASGRTNPLAGLRHRSTSAAVRGGGGTRLTETRERGPLVGSHLHHQHAQDWGFVDENNKENLNDNTLFNEMNLLFLYCSTAFFLWINCGCTMYSNYSLTFWGIYIIVVDEFTHCVPLLAKDLWLAQRQITYNWNVTYLEQSTDALQRYPPQMCTSGTSHQPKAIFHWSQANIY